MYQVYKIAIPSDITKAICICMYVLYVCMIIKTTLLLKNVVYRSGVINLHNYMSYSQIVYCCDVRV